MENILYFLCVLIVAVAAMPLILIVVSKIFFFGVSLFLEVLDLLLDMDERAQGKGA